MTTNKEPATTAKRLLSPGEVISHLAIEVEKGGNNSQSITTLVRHVLDDGQWHEYRSKATGVTRTHKSFQEFVKRGLGVHHIDLLTSWIEPVDKDVAGRLQRAWMEDIPPAGNHGGNRKADSAAPATPLPAQQSADGVLRRLKRDHPALADEVIQGTITATAAARKAGYQTPVVRLGKIETVAKKLADHYTPEELAELKNLI